MIRLLAAFANLVSIDMRDQLLSSEQTKQLFRVLAEDSAAKENFKQLIFEGSLNLEDDESCELLCKVID